jgi:hypothetical protein
MTPFVIPAKAGTSLQPVGSFRPGAPASAGATE